MGKSEKFEKYASWVPFEHPIYNAAPDPTRISTEAATRYAIARNSLQAINGIVAFLAHAQRFDIAVSFTAKVIPRSVFGVRAAYPRKSYFLNFLGLLFIRQLTSRQPQSMPWAET